MALVCSLALQPCSLHLIHKLLIQIVGCLLFLAANHLHLYARPLQCLDPLPTYKRVRVAYPYDHLY